MRVLIVEDDPALGDLLRRTIQRSGWAADLVAEGRRALEALALHPYDLVVLDRGLPDVDGVRVCRELRARGGRTPVLMLTARGVLNDRVEGLDSGADDYMVKPFAAEELLARLRALSRRHEEPLPAILRLDDLELDPAARRALRGNRELHLSAREFALLELFLRHPGRVFDRGTILERVWDDNFDPIGNVVDVLVGRLRRKVDADGVRPLIHTVRGAGYILSAKAPANAS